LRKAFVVVVVFGGKEAISAWALAQHPALRFVNTLVLVGQISNYLGPLVAIRIAFRVSL
jgi:hypothetical protein